MFCRICGKKMANSIKFCGNCGTKTNFVEKKKLAENKKKDVKTFDKKPEPWQETKHDVPQKETNKLKIFASLMVISLILSSLLFFYSKSNSEDDSDEINNINNFYSIGRQGQFYYGDIDQMMRRGFDTAKKITNS